MSHHRKLRTELSILEKSFPRNDGVFQIILASPEELVCRFYDPKGSKYNLQCSISVSGTLCMSCPLKSSTVFRLVSPCLVSL